MGSGWVVPSILLAIVARAPAVLAKLPEGFDSDTLQKIIVGMLVALGVAVIIVIRTFTKVTTRLAALAVIGALAAGLFVQRQNLEDCRGECSCRLFGQDVEVPDVGNFNCP